MFRNSTQGMDAKLYMHLKTSKMMPQYNQILSGDVGKKWDRRIRQERKIIARFYREVRISKEDGYGPESARLAHRYGVVINVTEARIRLKNMGVI